MIQEEVSLRAKRNLDFKVLLNKYKLTIEDLMFSYNGSNYFVNITYLDSVISSKKNKKFNLGNLIMLFGKALECEFAIANMDENTSQDEYDSWLDQIEEVQEAMDSFLGSYSGLENESYYIHPKCNCMDLSCIDTFGFKPIIKETCPVHAIV